MAWCLVVGNDERDSSKYGSGGHLKYYDRTLGWREYQGKKVTHDRGTEYWLFLIEVSDEELAEIEVASPQGRGGRKYGQEQDTGPWYVSYNPNVTWPGTSIRPELAPHYGPQKPRATAVRLADVDIQAIRASFD